MPDSHFVGRVDKNPNEIELGVIDDLGKLNRPHRTSSPLDNPGSLHFRSDALRGKGILGDGQWQVDGAQ